ncbi:transporter substrate-binding domain-containing protein [Uliginosibacterium sp. H3]|uniref:Transporter substrate-binding domain-containing protein n=1 Tax=Uliginosibacterium silvisoli TaxID=3114758 RepID=A0ABU6K2M5_9RHOO|nr:transporter substrate-binding domain-containing protein [Uliginosibacterium sp. H3]
MHSLANTSRRVAATPCRWLRRLTASCLTLLAVTQAHADLLARIRADGKVRVAMSAATPPFNYLDANNNLVGSEIDTARLLARGLGVKLEIVRIPASERVTVLLERRADLVLSTLSITPERERQIAFSVPYSQIPVVIAAPQAHQYNSMLDLDGKTVGILANSSNLTSLIHDAPGAMPLEYPENTKMLAGYAAGEFDILSAPQSLVDRYNRDKPKRPMVIQFMQSVFNIAVGMPNGEKPLRDWINDWVVANLRNDNLGAIYRKHHGGSLPTTIAPADSGKDARKDAVRK